ncbi:unnamed protein product [Rotaria sp. Silwood2]|nr:unnamed protein product [Rotaria sp. Silwood2]CAF4522572.1 unnamed protein product [Rotaria sp. Silwood2]
MKGILSKLSCMITQQGMKLPRESFIRSPMLLPDLPIITMNVVQEINENKIQLGDKQKPKSNDQSDDRILDKFLRFLGCRTIHVPSFIAYQKSQSHVSRSIKEHFLTFVALSNRCTTIDSNDEAISLFRPDELHFPWVAQKLESNTLRIIVWPDERLPKSVHNFLTMLGVREAPTLDNLIDLIAEDFESQKCEHDAASYIVPLSLRFLAKNVEHHYSELWKDNTYRRAFLPAQWPPNPITNSYDNNPCNSIELLPVERIFNNPNSLCACPLPKVKMLFSKFLDLSMLYVQEKPSLKDAFEILMERKDIVLTSYEWTCSVFGYMNSLTGTINELAELLSVLEFIPFQGCIICYN